MSFEMISLHRFVYEQQNRVRLSDNTQIVAQRGFSAPLSSCHFSREVRDDYVTSTVTRSLRPTVVPHRHASYNTELKVADQRARTRRK